MMSRHYPALALATLLAGSGVAQAQEAADASLCRISFYNGTVLENVELANTDALRVQGLSKRESAGDGMLFMWDDSQMRSFWMRDTWIPLAIAFIDADGLIVHATEMKPDTLTLHSSVKPVRFALELSPEQFAEAGLKTGERMQHLQCEPVTSAESASGQ